MDDVPVGRQTRPGKGGDSGTDAWPRGVGAGGDVRLKELSAMGNEGEALGDEVVTDEGKGPIRQDGGTHVE
jgi:hypothetical protein